MIGERQVDIGVGRQFLPPIAAERDNREPLDFHRLSLTDRHPRHALDQEVDDQAARSHDPRAADAEPIAELKPPGLQPEIFLERGEPPRAVRLPLDKTLPLIRLLADRI